MDLRNLAFECEGGVAHVELAREKAANAIDLETARELMEVALACDEDSAVRAVLFTGRGKLFCAGGDLAAFGSAGDGAPGLIKEITTYLHAAISRLARMDAPWIAAVGGTAAGAGMSLACAADFVLAGESAKFTMAYTRVGLSPDGSSTWFLPRLVGPRRTLELALTNRVLSAAEAFDWGLVNRVVPDGELLDQARELAGQLASGPTGAFGVAKRLVLSSATESLETQMELEARGIGDCARSPEGREGIAAFLAKRAPRFS